MKSWLINNQRSLREGNWFPSPGRKRKGEVFELLLDYLVKNKIRFFNVGDIAKSSGLRRTEVSGAVRYHTERFRSYGCGSFEFLG